MRRVSAKFVPMLLSGQQKENRKKISQDMLECASQDQNFMNIIITSNETWPMTLKQNCSHPNGIHPCQDQRKQDRCAAMLNWWWPVFFYYRGIMHHEYAPQGQLTKNTTWRFFTAFVKVCSENDPTCGQQRTGNSNMTKRLLVAHSTHIIQTFLVKHDIPLVYQASYSPGFASCDF